MDQVLGTFLLYLSRYKTTPGLCRFSTSNQTKPVFLCPTEVHPLLCPPGVVPVRRDPLLHRTHAGVSNAGRLDILPGALLLLHHPQHRRLRRLCGRCSTATPTCEAALEQRVFLCRWLSCVPPLTDSDPDKYYPDWYSVLIASWIFFGLAWLALVINHTMDVLEKLNADVKLRWGGQRQEDESSVVTEREVPNTQQEEEGEETK